jgi:hypothetical protein
VFIGFFVLIDLSSKSEETTFVAASSIPAGTLSESPTVYFQFSKFTASITKSEALFITKLAGCHTIEQIKFILFIEYWIGNIKRPDICKKK